MCVVAGMRKEEDTNCKQHIYPAGNDTFPSSAVGTFLSLVTMVQGCGMTCQGIKQRTTTKKQNKWEG